MMSQTSHINTYQSYHIMGSRLLTHVLFWVVYYFAYSYIWVSQLGWFASFYLEFILLPVRVVASYLMIYWLLPKYLLRQRYLPFLGWLVLMLLLCGLIQRLVVFSFYEEFFLLRGDGLFNVPALLKASLLVNTTVMLVMTIKLFGLYQQERQRNQSLNLDTLAIKADRRTHLVNTEDILFIEGLGNYICIYLGNGKQLTTYQSIKAFMQELPDNFIRCHKSFVVNSHRIDSFSRENITIRSHEIPRNKEVSDALLMGQVG